MSPKDDAAMLVARFRRHMHFSESDAAEMQREIEGQLLAAVVAGALGEAATAAVPRAFEYTIRITDMPEVRELLSKVDAVCAAATRGEQELPRLRAALQRIVDERPEDIRGQVSPQDIARAALESGNG